MPDVEFPANGSTATGYLATPDSGGPGVVVLQEWWGLEDHIRGICDRLAGEGFVALAPDLFHGETTDQPSEAEQKMMAMNIAEAEAEMRGAVDHVAGLDATRGDGVGTVGFCLGGGLSLWAAAGNPRVRGAVTYYYVMPHGKPDFTAIQAPVLGHFGTQDEFVPVDDAKALEQELKDAGVETTFDFYDAGHAFFNDTDRLGTYDRENAERSWQRTTEFLRGALG
ncbi:MAG: dienelactone hydrolase family protein [Solirubrobacterales bacterium]|nr:dienelactone hydrolase family protein [Solirubrobacterales bacterium]